MYVKIYIDNQIIDYSDNANLPFILKVAYRDFKKIGETESIDLENAASSLLIPATKRNKAILEGNENTFFTFEVVRNGQNFFKGRCRVSNKQYERFNLVGYSLELYGGTADIFEQLEGLSLRDLDLGQIGYSVSSVLASWSGFTSDSNLAIYLPAVYGTLNSGVVDEFELEDMRPAVYYETILAGIESYLNITIDSHLRQNDLWKRCVHLFGVGELWENFSDSISTNQVAVGTETTLTYTQSSSDTIIYKVEINIPSGNNSTSDLFELEINSDAGYVQRIAYDVTNGNNVISAEIQLDNVGEKIRLEGHKTSGSSLTLLPAGSQFLVKSTTKVVEGSSVKIASCLHDIDVKDWLKEMFLQFNLVSFYNPVTRTLKLDPAFNFIIGNSEYEGFYTTENPRTIKTDSTKATKSYQPIYDRLVFSYQKNGDTEKIIDQYIEHTTHPLNCIDISLNEGTNEKEYTSLYFNMSNGLVDGITTRELPILVDQDVKLFEDGAAGIEAPTFITEPKNALVTGEPVGLYFEGVYYTSLPLARQNNLRKYKNYTLTFSDAFARSSVFNGINKGLISIFYSHYFSILSRLEILTIDISVDNILDIETYRNVYIIENEYYILIELKNVKHNSTYCKGVFVKYDMIRNTDSSFYDNHNPEGALQILNIT